MIMLIALVVFGLITFVTASMVTKRAKRALGAEHGELASRLSVIALLGSLTGCVAADIFSSAYLRAVAGSLLDGLSNFGGRSRGRDDPFEDFVMLTVAEHLFVMVMFAFVGASLACWGYYRYHLALTGPRSAEVAVPARDGLHCAACGSKKEPTDRYCPNCGAAA